MLALMQLLQKLKKDSTINYKRKSSSLFAVETPIPVLGLGQGFKGSSADVEDKNADVKWNYRALHLPAVRPSIIFCLSSLLPTLGTGPGKHHPPELNLNNNYFRY